MGQIIRIGHESLIRGDTAEWPNGISKRESRENPHCRPDLQTTACLKTRMRDQLPTGMLYWKLAKCDSMQTPIIPQWEK